MGQRSSTHSKVTTSTGQQAASTELYQAGARAAALLQVGRFSEAQAALARCLRAFEGHSLSKDDLPVLRSVALPALGVLPRLVAQPGLQASLAFVVSGLVASVAMKCDGNASLTRRYADLLEDSGRLMATAWQPRGALVSQTADNNRFLLRLCAIMSEQEVGSALQLRSFWAELAARCLETSTSDFWSSQFFSSNLQAVLAAFVHAPPASSTRLARPLLRLCYRGSWALPTAMLLERVLLFQEAWSSHMLKGSSLKGSELQATLEQSWITASLELVGAQDVMALTPAASLAAYFLSRAAEAGHRRGESSDKARLDRLTAGLRVAVAAGHGDGLLRSSVLASALQPLAPGASASPEALSAWFAAAAATLRDTALGFLLPANLLERPLHELEAHRASAVCRVLLPRATSALAYCLSWLEARAQLEMLSLPLEAWALDFSRRRTGSFSQEQPLIQWFCSSAFLALAALVREADLSAISPSALLYLLRAMSCLDVFRDDTQEYRALCLSVVEQGSEDGNFIQALLWTLLELFQPFGAESANNEASSQTSALGAASRLHFWLGALANPRVIDAPDFFPAAWPVVVACAGGVRRALGRGRGGLAPRELTSVAARANALAAVSLSRAGTAGREEQVRDFVSSALDGVSESPEGTGKVVAAARHALLGAIEAIATDVARRSTDGADPSRQEAAELQRWLLATLGRYALDALLPGPPLGTWGSQEETAADGQSEGRGAAVEAGEAFFAMLCSAARHVDVSILPELLYSEAHMADLLRAHPPLRELWLRHLVSRFPEAARELLVLRLLEDFPEAAAAFSAPYPAILTGPEASSSVLRSAL